MQFAWPTVSVHANASLLFTKSIESDPFYLKSLRFIIVVYSPIVRSKLDPGPFDSVTRMQYERGPLILFIPMIRRAVNTQAPDSAG